MISKTKLCPLPLSRSFWNSYDILLCSYLEILFLVRWSHTITRKTKSRYWRISLRGPYLDDEAIKLDLLNTNVTICDVIVPSQKRLIKKHVCFGSTRFQSSLSIGMSHGLVYAYESKICNHLFGGNGYHSNMCWYVLIYHIVSTLHHQHCKKLAYIHSIIIEMNDIWQVWMGL